MKFLSLLLSLSLLPTALHAGHSEISARMKSLADGLVKSYRVKHPAAGKEKIAVFEFNSSKELHARRVGHAVAELLTHHINGDSGFVLVERLELNKILEELKLNMAGVADQDDALKAGRLGGAKAVVLGSVEKFGDKYHVNARLVAVETGEVSATAYEAMPVRVFEEEAKDYIVLVPEKQRIGIYTLFNWRHNGNNLPVTAATESGSTRTTTPKPFDIGLAGIGFRYAPDRNLLLDFAYLVNTTFPRAGRQTEDWSGTPIHDDGYSIGVKEYRGLAGYRLRLTERFSGYVSGGVAYYQVMHHADAGYATPTVQLRSEYFLQQRLGISLAANYDLAAKTATKIYVTQQRSYRVVKLSKLSVESSLSVYF